MGRIDELPPKVLDRIIDALYTSSPKEVVPTLLGTLSEPLNEAIFRTIFGARQLIIPDDARLFDRPSLLRGNPASALIANPGRYASFVRRLAIVDPTVFGPVEEEDLPGGRLGLFSGDCSAIEEEEEEEVEREVKSKGDGVRPLDAETVKALLSSCEELEELLWASSCPPPDGLFEDLVTFNSKLTCFSYKPNANANSSSAVKWDAPSLLLLAPFITLTHLTLTRLSQTGSQAFSLLLNTLAEDSSSCLQSLELNFVWLDDALCQRIVSACRRTLKKVIIGTQGTKLTDSGVVEILEGLEALEEFGLVDVEGRLSKALWTKVAVPSSLSKLAIGIPDVGPSHSWSLDHLKSLPSFPLSSIRHLAIVRTSSVLGTIEGSSIERGNNLQPVPREVLKALVANESKMELESLECDWWSWSPEDIKLVLERCGMLKSLKLAFDAPFPKLLALANSIASASNLSKIAVVIPAEHVPSPPPSPSVATPGNPLSPGSSPVVNFSSRSLLTPLRGSVGLPPSPTTSSILRRDSMSKSYTTPSFLSVELPSAPGEGAPSSPSASISGSPLISLSGSIPSLDTALPPLRDMKKLFKRCLALREVEWIGRGSWILDPSSRTSNSKTTSLANMKVDFELPRSAVAYEEEYERKRIEEDAAKWGWSPSAAGRVGQEWVGEAAEEAARDMERFVAEKERETSTVQATRSPVKRRAPTLPIVSPSPASSTSPVKSTATVTSDMQTRGGGSGRHRHASSSHSDPSRSSTSSANSRPSELEKPVLTREGSQSSSSSSQSIHSQSDALDTPGPPSTSAPRGLPPRQRGGHRGRGRGRSVSEGDGKYRGPRSGEGGEAHLKSNSGSGEQPGGEHRRGGHGRGSHRKSGPSVRGHVVYIGSSQNKRGSNASSSRTSSS